MNLHSYYDEIIDKLAVNFDIQKYPSMFAEKIDILASCKITDEKFFVSKKLPIWSCENNEHCLLKGFSKVVDEEEFMNFVNILKANMRELVSPHSEHMQTVLTGCIVSEKGFQENVIKKAENFKYRKSFLFSLHGWCDLRIILVDLESDNVYCNKRAMDVKKFYKPNLN